MATKKKTATTTPGGQHTLKIGSRVRRTDDGVEGRIVWANGVSVKVKWDDGEQVTWRRDSLAQRPIEILGGDEELGAPMLAAAAGEPAEDAAPEARPAGPEATPEPVAVGTPAEDAPAIEPPPAAPEPAQEPPAAETPTEGPTGEQTAPDAADAATRLEPGVAAAETPAPHNEPAKPKRQRKSAAEPQEKKLSVIDAAARVLAEAGQPMRCQELIGAMAAKGYWTSPGGKTPTSTLYSAILREVATRGDRARFAKAGRGKFARHGL